ncbi:hypothetical protein [Salinifilum ghardaiensis]
MGSGGGFHTDSGELQRLASTLRSSTQTIDEATEASPPAADAGRSTAKVQEMISQFAKAAAGLRGGVAQAADDVARSGDTYRQSDEDGKDRLPNAGEHGGGR